ncbi:hypothetical protein ABZP36_019445 [Zizania latifolia]
MAWRLVYQLKIDHLEALFWYWSLTHLMPLLVPDLTLCAPTSAAAFALTKLPDAAALTLPATVFFSFFASSPPPPPPPFLKLPSSPEAHWSAQVGASFLEPMECWSWNKKNPSVHKSQLHRVFIISFQQGKKMKNPVSILR